MPALPGNRRVALSQVRPRAFRHRGSRRRWRRVGPDALNSRRRFNWLAEVWGDLLPIGQPFAGGNLAVVSGFPDPVGLAVHRRRRGDDVAASAPDIDAGGAAQNARAGLHVGGRAEIVMPSAAWRVDAVGIQAVQFGFREADGFKRLETVFPVLAVYVENDQPITTRQADVGEGTDGPETFNFRLVGSRILEAVRRQRRFAPGLDREHAPTSRRPLKSRGFHAFPLPLFCRLLASATTQEERW